MILDVIKIVYIGDKRFPWQSVQLRDKVSMAISAAGVISDIKFPWQSVQQE